MRGVLVENLLLGLGGGLGGFALASLGMKGLLRLAASLPRVNEVHLSGAMLALAVGLSVLTSLGFGMFAALRSLRVAPQSALQGSSAKATGGRQTARTRKVLVAVQVACGVTLLIVTGLITRSFSQLLNQDRSFSAEHVEMARASLTTRQYASPNDWKGAIGADSGSRAGEAMVDRTLAALRSLPGVEMAAATSALPLSGGSNGNLLTRPDHPLPDGQAPIADLRVISPGYFATMKIPLLAGREFDARDRENPRVAIISEKSAKVAWPGENALGRTLTHWDQVYTIVGIAADARVVDLKHNVPVYYLPYWDYPPDDPVFLVRSAMDGDAVGAMMRRVIWSVDPEISIPSVWSLDQQVSDSVATERFQAVILSSFGGAALLLALLGIYGVLTYTVSLRMQEFGIRVALGSSKGLLARLVLLDAAWPVLGGIVLGLAGAAVAVHWVRSVLYETSAADPWAIGMSVGVLLLAAILAALLPARSAASVDPMRVLRGE